MHYKVEEWPCVALAGSHSASPSNDLREEGDGRSSAGSSYAHAHTHTHTRVCEKAMRRSSENKPLSRPVLFQPPASFGPLLKTGNRSELIVQGPCGNGLDLRAP